jgi:hypothetical protein
MRAAQTIWPERYMAKRCERTVPFSLPGLPTPLSGGPVAQVHCMDTGSALRALCVLREAVQAYLGNESVPLFATT